MCLTRLNSHIIPTSHNLSALIRIRGYVAVGGGVMQLHGGCRFASGASAARAEPLHVLVLSGRAAGSGLTCWGGCAGEGHHPRALVKINSLYDESRRRPRLWRDDAVDDAAGYGRCANMFRTRDAA